LQAQDGLANSNTEKSLIDKVSGLTRALKILRYRIPWTATLLIGIACAVTGQDESLSPKIHGRYQYTVYQGRENPIFSKELDFTIQIRGCRMEHPNA
jgi:hypothetical protein